MFKISKDPKGDIEVNVDIDLTGVIMFGVAFYVVRRALRKGF